MAYIHVTYDSIAESKKIRSISIAQVSPEECGLGETVQPGYLKQLYSTEMEQWPLSVAVKAHYSIN